MLKRCFNQVVLNSFGAESGVPENLDKYLEIYYSALTSKQPNASSYSLDDLKDDVRLIFADHFLQYMMFTAGSLPV